VEELFQIKSRHIILLQCAVLLLRKEILLVKIWCAMALSTMALTPMRNQWSEVVPIGEIKPILRNSELISAGASLFVVSLYY
jgi:hypothetical protein